MLCILTERAELWAIIESLSPDIKVQNIKKEFELKGLKEFLHEAEENEKNARVSK